MWYYAGLCFLSFDFLFSVGYFLCSFIWGEHFEEIDKTHDTVLNKVTLPVHYRYYQVGKGRFLYRYFDKTQNQKKISSLINLQDDHQTLLPRNSSQYPRSPRSVRPRLRKPFLGLDTQPKSSPKPLASPLTSLTHFRWWQWTRASLVRICWRWTSFSCSLW